VNGEPYSGRFDCPDPIHVSTCGVLGTICAALDPPVRATTAACDDAYVPHANANANANADAPLRAPVRVQCCRERLWAPRRRWLFGGATWPSTLPLWPMLPSHTRTHTHTRAHPPLPLGTGPPRAASTRAPGCAAATRTPSRGGPATHSSTSSARPPHPPRRPPPARRGKAAPPA
jgi:hypothetical protein